jgi:hypothetical protein
VKKGLMKVRMIVWPFHRFKLEYSKDPFKSLPVPEGQMAAVGNELMRHTPCFSSPTEE